MVKRWLKEYINKNIYDILCTVVMLVIGIVVGIGIYFFSSEETKVILTTSARSIFELSRDEAYVKTNIISNGLQINIILLVILAISSVTLFGKHVIHFIAMLKGVAISIYMAVLFKIFGLGYGLAAVSLLIILVNLIYIPSFIYLLVTFLEINFNIFKTRILNVNILDRLCILGKIGLAFIGIFSSIILEQVMSSIVLSIFLKVV